MNLPEDDETFLRGKGFDWSLIPDGDGGLLVVQGFAVSGAKYDRASTDLMIRIPAQYNMAKLDMWYVDPPLRLTGTNQFPHQAAVFENHGGRTWQRFSRHLPEGTWRAGVDGLPMFFTFISGELR
jgi:hypothetical protein